MDYFHGFEKMFCIYCLVWCLVISSSISYGEDIESINDINDNKVDISLSGDISSLSVKPETTTKIAPQKLVCPNKQTRVPFFSPSCKTTHDCSFLGPGLVCCNSRCMRGVVPPKPEPNHTPLFGVIDRVCPSNPMPEFMAIQECATDEDCGRRICCPEQAPQGGVSKNYCRNAAPRFNRMPTVRQILLPLKSFTSYLQCTPPPPPFLDLFPRPCQSLFDCFPNLCCQEYGKRVCRPPMKSLFTLIASTATRVGTSTLAKNFIQRIS